MVFADLLKTQYGENKITSTATKQQRGLQGFWNTAEVWPRLIETKFARALLNKVKTAGGTFLQDEIIVMSYFTVRIGIAKSGQRIFRSKLLPAET